MNKKVNTVLFILGATVFNILVTIIAFLALFAIYANFLMPLLSEEGSAWGFPVIFLLSIIAAFFLYRFTLKLLMKKIDVDKYFDPIFVFNKRK